MHALVRRIPSLFIPFNCQFSSTPHPQLECTPRPPPPLPIELWMEIFQFATYVHRSATLKSLDPFTRKRACRNALAQNSPIIAMHTKLSLVLVSRQWRAIALRILYDHTAIRSPARANAVLRVLEESRHKPGTVSDIDEFSSMGLGYGQWVKHLEIHTHARGASKLRYLETLFSIFQLCPNVRILSGSWLNMLPAEFLKCIITIFGSNLQELYWNERGPDGRLERDTLTSPEFLGSFKELRVLDLRHFNGCSGMKKEQAMTLATRPTLPFVQDLILSAHSRSLEAAISLSLPALQNLTLKTSPTDDISSEVLSRFLKAHGRSLVNVDLPIPSSDLERESETTQTSRVTLHINPDVFLQPDACPNLLSLSFPVTSPQLAPYVHKSLRRIGLRGVRGDGLYPDKPSACKDHLKAITPTRYPGLELVWTVNFLVEADSDGLMEDIFIWWVERFEKYGIDFLDGEGVLWMHNEENAPKKRARNHGASSPLASVNTQSLNDIHSPVA